MINNIGVESMCDNWYAVQVRAGREEEIIEKCAILLNQDALIECFVPKTKKMKKYGGKWHEVPEILFKGYVFMISDHVEQLFNELKKIPDLTKILGNDGTEIYSLRKEEVLFLMRFGGEQHIVEMSSGFIEGDQIRITYGPLQGQEGNIVKIDRHKRTAYIDVSIFGQVIRVQVGLEIVSKK